MGYIKEIELRQSLGAMDMYLIDLVQKGYFVSAQRIVDVGCGSGRNVWPLAQLGNSILGIDQNPEVVEEVNQWALSNEMHNVTARVGDLGSSLDLEEVFDFVICNAVLHFAKDQNHFHAMFTDLLRLVKPEGVVFCRFVSSHTLPITLGPFNRVMDLPDGSNRFVVDMEWFKHTFLNSKKRVLLAPIKTVNVDGLRTMTTLVFKTE
jgi:2-polyprenyl-3-methyl-5-hydroxy-6-metoxy-1,4-benzoquinol methylase